MQSKSESIRGVKLGLGIVLKRSLHLEDLPLAVGLALFPTVEWIRLRSILRQTARLLSPVKHTSSNILSKAHKEGYDGDQVALRLPQKGDHNASLSTAASSSASIICESCGALSTQLRTLISNYLLICAPALASISPIAPSVARRPLVVLGAVSFAVGSLILPIIYPLEVTKVTGDFARESGIEVGDRLLFARDNRVPVYLGAKKVSAWLSLKEFGENVPVVVRRKATKSSRSKLFKIDLVQDYVVHNQINYCLFTTKNGKTCGYIAIKEFNDESFHEFKIARDELISASLNSTGHPLKGLVVDLRGNPGGPVAPAVDIAALFLRPSKVVTQMGTRGRVNKYWSTNRRPDLDTSLLLLTDSYTASASEILVEALCDNSRAVTMGEKTFGKNLAQVRRPSSF